MQASGLHTLAGAENVPLVCSAAKPVVSVGETILVRAYAASKDVSISWSVSTGKIFGNGPSAFWDFHTASLGHHEATATSITRDGKRQSCTMKVLAVPFLTPKGDRVNRRCLLAANGKEKSGYGLYSYILLTRPISKAHIERNEMALRAYWAKMPALSELDRGYDPMSINTAYIFVKRMPQQREVDAQDLVKLYDYDRSLRVIELISDIRREGPLIVASRVPLSTYAGGPLIILYDLSIFPARTIPPYVDEFLDQASQQDFKASDAVSRLSLRLRTVIGVLSEAVPIKGDLNSILSVISKK